MENRRALRPIDVAARSTVLKIEFPFSETLKVSNGTDYVILRLLEDTFTLVSDEDYSQLRNDPPIILNRLGFPEVSNEDCCVKYVELSYEIKCAELNENLLRAAKRFLSALRAKHTAKSVPPYLRPVLNFTQAEPFSCELITSMENKFLSAVYWGNIQGGVFLSHWEVSFPDSDSKAIDGSNRKDGEFYVDFEFDRCDMISVRFKNMEREKNRGLTLFPTYYQIVLQQTSIRRIIVDNAANGCCCRIFLELLCPPLVKRFIDFNSDGKNGPPALFRYLEIRRCRRRHEYSSPEALVDGPYFVMQFASQVNTKDIYKILARLRARTGAPIEFAAYEMVDSTIGILQDGERSPYTNWIGEKPGYLGKEPSKFIEKWNPCHDESKPFQFFLNAAFPRRSDAEPSVQREIAKQRFAIRYLLECLMSRGALTKDLLWISGVQWHFFLLILAFKLKQDFSIVEQALERLIVMIDERKRILHPILAFIECCRMISEERMSMMGLDDDPDMIREGYQRVRKVIFTPTRIIYIVPEILMSNRVLRSYDPDGIDVLRVQFRDDDNSKMRKNKTSMTHIERTIEDKMIKGVKIAGNYFGYLGSSNSQMRDNGAYFMLKNTNQERRDWNREHNLKKNAHLPYNIMQNIIRTRGRLGRFDKIESVPKLMARLGQCFTQSRQTTIPVKRTDYCTIWDIEGGGYKGNLNAYNFTDGAAIISEGFATTVAHDMGCGAGVPSCYQIRFRGMKGILVVNPELDDVARWAEDYKIPSPATDEDHESRQWNNDVSQWKVCFAFRDSQKKFDGAKKEEDFLEIVKFSSPVPVALNRPFINILDQVSEMQSMECHRRMCNRIETLLDRQLRGFAAQLVDEQSCRNRLNELPGRIPIEELSTLAGFQLSSEPYFRSLVKAATRYAVNKQLRKEQIQIPYEFGRSMFGVPDESGRLQYGQIFVQYSTSIAEKFPAKNAAKKVVVGKVLLTKNPCVVAGDVRVFEAVDIPELRHLVNVVVFPTHGPRTHPDEMAGSDLDGDEYSVIWDPELFLDYNEPAFDFAADKVIPEPVDDEKLQSMMTKFYISYVTQDAVGSISNAFLFQSDFYGINSTVCQSLAKKNCLALDFPKSGKAPDDFTTKWTLDPETGEKIPPEKIFRVPDFHTAESGKPIYVSNRLIGKLFRELKLIEEVIRLSGDRDEQMEVDIDPLLEVEDWEDCRGQAENDLQRYLSSIRAVMENYGIKTEAELFSGCIMEMRNKISDKDQDDMSLFNTNQVIETKVTNIFRKARERFFEEFDGGWKQVTQPLDRRAFANSENVCHRKVSNPTEAMKKKAIAYYKVCYERAQRTKEKKLSFAWLAFDILAYIRREAVLKDRNFHKIDNPLLTIIDNHCERYCEENEADLVAFAQKYQAENVNKAGNRTMRDLCLLNPGLERVMFVVDQWAKKCELINETFRSEHFSMLFVLFATNRFASIDGAAVCGERQFERIIDMQSMDNAIVEPIPVIAPWKLLLAFFEFIASRKFLRLDELSFRAIGSPAVFTRGEWAPIHQAGRRTYYQLVFNLRFEELRLRDEELNPLIATIRECEPFTIELAKEVSDVIIEDKLLKKTGCEAIKLRRFSGKNNTNRAMVSARGSLEALDKLRKLVAASPPKMALVDLEEMSAEMLRLVNKKIMA